MKKFAVLFIWLVFLLGFIEAAPAFAQTAPLTVACSVAVSNNVATWGVSASGGVAPYTYKWSGDASVNGSAANTIHTTYSQNGTFVGTVVATDASSTAATTTCQAVVNYFGTSTATTTHKTVNATPELVIGGKGQVTANDMIVQSVGSGSLTASVWGVTYTITPPANFSLSTVLAGDQLTVVGKVSSSTPTALVATSIKNLSVSSAVGKGTHPWQYRFDNSGRGDDGRGIGSSTPDKGSRGIINKLMHIKFW